MRNLLNRLRAFWADHERRRTIAWLCAVLGGLALIYGALAFITAHNEYTQLAETAERIGPPTDPNDPSNTAFALLLRERDQAQNRRWQGLMFVGLGVVGVGLAFLFFPEAAKTQPVDITAAPPGEPPDQERPA